MRILWVKLGGLWPLNTGGRLRSFHIIAELTRRHRVTLVTTHGPRDDPAGLAAQLVSCEQVISYSPTRFGMNHTGMSMPGIASCVTRIAMILKEWMTSLELT